MAFFRKGGLVGGHDTPALRTHVQKPASLARGVPAASGGIGHKAIARPLGAGNQGGVRDEQYIKPNKIDIDLGARGVGPTRAAKIFSPTNSRKQHRMYFRSM